jgi:hypothetical protein
MLYLGGDDPEKLKAVANRIAKEMEGIPGLRAPRVGSQLRSRKSRYRRGSTWRRISG